MASAPVLSPSVPDNVAAARKQVQTSDFFALCYLMLCQLAYADEDNGQKAVQQITNLLPTMPVPQGGVQGKWSLAWGPRATSDNSNLMYAAEFSDSASGLPVFSAVVIRGTDTQARPSGIVKQLVEDLDAAEQVVFPVNNQAGSKIAQGTQDGLNVLTGFTDSSNRTVEQYVNAFVTQNPGAPVVVTGHSLGGCQTTVMALYLSGKLREGASIVPNSFAAPTAGNQAFIQLYEQTFPFCPRWFNTLDLVPMAFAGLDGIKQLWSQCARPAPDVVRILIDALKFILKFRKASYSQQSTAQGRTLEGACQADRPLALPAAVENQAVREIQTLLEKAAPKLLGRAGDVASTMQKILSRIPFIGGAAGFLSSKITADSFLNLGAWVHELLFQHLILTGYWNVVQKSQGVAFIRNPFGLVAGAGGNR